MEPINYVISNPLGCAKTHHDTIAKVNDKLKKAMTTINGVRCNCLPAI
jgi:hypothetical protein